MKDRTAESDHITVLVAAGGTGGDFFPAVAVVEELKKLVPMGKFEFVGNPRRIEAEQVPKLGFAFHPISMTGWKGLRSIDSYFLPIRLFTSLRTCLSLIRRNKPDAILCAGTYISVPLAMAGKMLGIPIVLIESNALPGKANRLIGRWAEIIITAFDECAAAFREKSHAEILNLGNPTRGDFGNLQITESTRSGWGLDPKKRTLLVFGGSLGARSINTAVEESLEEFDSLGVQVIWQTGRNFKHARPVPEYVKSIEFIDDMATAYSACDLVLSRAGGGTIAELKVVGKPSILIPYPHSANQEQDFNADSMVRSGASIKIHDRDLNIETLLAELRTLLSDSARLDSMSKSALSLGRPNAAFESAKAIVKLARDQAQRI